MDPKTVQLDFARFIRPGVLWWAYNPFLARRRGIELVIKCEPKNS